MSILTKLVHIQVKDFVEQKKVHDFEAKGITRCKNRKYELDMTLIVSSGQVCD